MRVTTDVITARNDDISKTTENEKGSKDSIVLRSCVDNEYCCVFG